MSRMMRWTGALLVLTGLLWAPARVEAQPLGEVFRKMVPSVVVIRAKGGDVAPSGQTGFSEIGSGVLISTDGQVMTAAHLVHTMAEITVEFIGGETVNARVISSEPAADLSMLKLDRVPAGTKPAPLADSAKVQVGDQVVIVGAPYGLSYSLSAGWISARWAPNTVYRAFPMAEFFQTDAVINTGNSGGPMFNLAGEVIGIVSHNISKSGGSEGLGFVVTPNSAKSLLLERESFWAGMEGVPLSGDLAALFNLPQPVGYLVKVVAKDSPAESAGLLGGTMTAKIGGEEIVVGGDIILGVEGISVGGPESAEQVRNRLASMPPGSAFKVAVLRAGKVLEFTGRVPAQ